MPVFGENLFELHDDWSRQPEMHVDGRRDSATIGHMLITDIHATGKTDLAVDDQQFAVIAHVDAQRRRNQSQRQEAGMPNAGSTTPC